MKGIPGSTALPPKVGLHRVISLFSPLANACNYKHVVEIRNPTCQKAIRKSSRCTIIKSSVLKETIRKIVPASSSADEVHNLCNYNQEVAEIQIIDAQESNSKASPASSEPNDGIGDTAMSGIEVSLSALKEASALTAKIPYISFVAGRLLQALHRCAMRDASEAKQYKEEWELVMEKVEKVAGLVAYVGTSCEPYKLEEKDLPPGLRTSFECLETELNGIGHALATYFQLVTGSLPVFTQPTGSQAALPKLTGTVHSDAMQGGFNLR
ncbi:hypothetical protein BC826DRAFT_1187701 [Russula brevipes]|nr:hypothetical protein BC826DRAFT_1187701 [Russula brevipes]